MPPRPSKSPAKVRSASPAKPVKSPATSKSPAAKKETPAKTPKSTKATKEVKATKSPAADVAQAKAATPASSPAPTKPAAAEIKTKSTPKIIGVISILSVLVPVIALVGGYVGAKPEKIGWVSAKMFDGVALKDTSSSALIAFMDSRKDCFACADLDKEFSNPEFLKLAEGWKKQKLLKIGKVKCWKNEELCRGFGVAGDDDDAKGYPTLLHFKDGKQVSEVHARTSADLQQWVADAKMAGGL